MKNALLDRAVETVRKELVEKGVIIDAETIKSTYEWYNKSITKLVNYGVLSNKEYFFKKLDLPGLGTLVLKDSKFKDLYYRRVHGDDKSGYDYNDGIQAFRELKDRGWALAGWTEDSGFIFINEFSGLVYRLKREVLFNNLSAYIYFNKIADTEFVEKGYEVYLGDNITPFKYIGGGIKIYNYDRKLIREYDTLEEAYKGHYLPKDYILERLIFNYYTPRRPRRIRDEYWYFDTVEDDYTNFNPTYLFIKDRTVYDLLDKKGNVLIERLGTLTDMCEYLVANGYTNICKTGVLRTKFKQNKSIYGFKFRRSSIQVSKFEEDRNRQQIKESK